MSGLNIARQLSTNPIRSVLDQKFQKKKKEVAEATEAYDSHLKVVQTFFEHLGKSEQLQEILDDVVWQATASEDFKTKYMEHEYPAVQKLAVFHAVEISLIDELEAADDELTQVKLDEKATDGDRVIKHSIDDLCLQLSGIVKLNGIAKVG